MRTATSSWCSARPDVDADGIVQWPTDQHVIGFRYETDRPHVEYIDR